MQSSELVSVVIPAYNAERTLAGTLRSVQRQSHAALEIIVVDDGSRDGTVALARSLAARDPRIRVIAKQNGGAAKARNIGIAASKGRFIAPLDHDDVWHPDKIDRQLAVMRAHADIGYVYTHYRRIGEDDAILYSCTESPIEGAVYLRSLLYNFVGNGSSLLVRREALEEIGGYTGMHRRPGDMRLVEDWVIQLLIARRWKVGCVGAFLTGYRLTGGSLSEDEEEMARSHIAMLDHMRCCFPESPAHVLAASEARMMIRLALLRLRARSLREAGAAFRRALALDPRLVGTVIGVTGARAVRAGLARIGGFGSASSDPTTGRPFFDVDPDEGPPQFERGFRSSLAALATEEDAFLASAPHRAASSASARVVPEAASSCSATIWMI